MKKILALVAALVFAASQPAYGHSSNQHYDKNAKLWVENKCSTSLSLDYAVILFQHKNFKGLGLVVCDRVKNLRHFSFGNSAGSWNNRASSMGIIFYRPTICKIGLFDHRASTGRFWYTLYDEPDLSVDNFDNIVTSISAENCSG